MAETQSQPAAKIARRGDGMPRVTHSGLPRAYFHDVYAWALRASWGVILALFAVTYTLINVVFAGLYLAAGDTIAGARPGSFADAFHFSVQTLSTIGYGQLTPQGMGHAIVAVESAVGIIVVALATGLVFSKFSRPTSRVLFSKRIVIHERNGARTLMFRIANARGNEIIEASVRCTALKNEITAEGDRMRVLHDMALRRDTNPVFSLSWLVMHTIDENSPLHGMNHADMEAGDVRVVVSFTGIDNTLSQTVHAHHMFFAEDIEVDRRFVDVISRLPEGGVALDLEHFHDTEPLPAKKSS